MHQYNKIIIIVIILSIAIAILSYTFVQQKKADQNPIYENQSAGKLLNEQNFTGNSVELSLNSRVSYHEGYSGKAPDQWLSNVLWAAGRAPVTSDPRNIYITTTQGRYHFDPENNSLSNRSSGYSNVAAFVIDYDGEPGFDAGVSYMFAILESVSMWNGTKSQLVSCPKQEKLYFGIMDVERLTDELATRSSDGSLPVPKTRGNNSVHDVIQDLKYTREFKKEDISLEDLSQILWAGYGNTPHMSYNGRGGLTVPSWYADYYLTGNIYVMKHDGVFRYHNRNPDNDLTTRDHRLEKIKNNDVRDLLRSSIKELPDAPCYIILSLDNDDLDKWYARLESGFVAGNMLLQGSAMGVGSWFTTELSDDEIKSAREFTGIKADDVPLAIVSIGY